MKTLRTVLTLACVLTSALHAAVTQIWDARYSGPGGDDDIPTSLVVDSADNVIVTGYSIGSGGNFDFYTAKYALANGALLWEKRYNGPANNDDRAKCVAADKAGNVVVAGYSTGIGTSFDFYTAKYAAANGALLWEKRYDGGIVDSATSVAVDSVGNVVVTGYSTGTGNFDYYTAKYAAANGALLWEKRYNGPGNGDDVPSSVVVDSANNVIVTGSSVGTPPLTDYYTAKYAAADGALLWEKRYKNGNTYSSATSVAVDSADNVVVTGSSGGSNGDDYYTAKYAATNGALLWEQRYNGPGNASDIATGVAVDSGGNVAVTGRSMGNGSDYDYYTAKYAAADGALLWEKRYNGNNGRDQAASIAIDAAGNVVVTGYSFATNFDYYTASYAAADGQLLWENRYFGTANGDDLMLGTGQRYLALASDGSAIVTGQSRNASNYDYATVRYGAPDLMTLPPLLTAPGSGTLTKNPVSVTFTLPEVAATGTVKLTFAGATTTILTLANTQGASGAHSFTFNPANPTASPEIASGNTIVDGTYTVTLQYNDILMNAPATVSSSDVTIDTTPPDTTIDSGPGGTVNSSTATFTVSASEAGATILGSLDGGIEVEVFGKIEFPNLAEGVHIFRAYAIDAGGNADPTPATRTWTVDTVPPDTTINSGPNALVKNTTATLTFSASEAGSTFLGSLDGAAEVAVSSPKVYANLADGPHTFTVRAIDPAGNADSQPAMRTWTVDTIPPQTYLLEGPIRSVNSDTATFTFDAKEPGATFLGSLDGGPEVAVVSPKPYFKLAQGPHTFTVRAIDSAGNADPSPETRTWIVDTIVPDTEIDAGPSGTVKSTTATFAFSASEPETIFLGSLDGQETVVIPSPTVFNGLADGPHTFTVRAVDAAGNSDPTPATRAWTVDTIPPETKIDSGPSGMVSNSVATFTFSTNEPASFLGSLDGGAEMAVSSPAAFNGLAEGTHTFSVRAIDAGGNADPTPATRTWTVDTIPPETTIDAGPSGVFNGSEVTFEFSSNEPDATFLVSFNGGAEFTAVSPLTDSGVTEGTYTFSVRARDAAGNVDPTPATRTWTRIYNPAHDARQVRGGAVPGAGSDGIPAGAVWADFGVPAINDAGMIAFRGKWSSPAGGGMGIFVDDTLVAGTGDTTQALGPATLAAFGEPVLDAAGHVAFLATVEGNGVIPGNSTALMTNAFGELEVVARTGAATNGAGSPRLKAIKSISLVDGELLFTARLQGGTPAVTSANDFAAYRVASPGPLGYVARVGDGLPGLTVKGFQLLTAVAGSPGQGRGHAAGQATFLTLLANGSQRLVESEGGTIHDLVHTSSPTGSTLLPSSKFKGFRVPSADGSRLAFLATLFPGTPGVTVENAAAIFMGDPVSGFESVAQIGQLTGVGATTFGGFQNPVLAPGLASVAFPAILRGTTTARDASLWWQPAGGPLKLLAREGAMPPDVGVYSQWASFTSLALPGATGAVGAVRGPLFVATMVRGPGGVEATNDAGLWAVNSTGELHTIFRKGDTIADKKLKSFTVLNAVSGSPGVTRAFNNNGQVAWRAVFTDGSTAIVVTQVP